MKVLLVVDVQNDFCPGGSLAVNEGDKVVPVINRLMREGNYDLIIASKDWHPADHLSFAANNPGKELFETIDLDGLPQVMWPVHCVQGTPGAEFHPELDTDGFDYVIEKGLQREVDSYSAFCDNGGKNETRLLSLIKEEAAKKGISAENIKVDVTGLALDYCVAETARGAAERGLETAVILDASRAVDQSVDGGRSLFRELMERGIELVTSSDRLPGREVSRDHREIDRGIQL